MVFSSHAFLVFMLVLLAVYAGVTRWAPRHAKLTLVLASLLFYGWTIPAYLVLLGLSLAFNYVLSAGLAGPQPEGRRRLLLTLGVGANLAFIGYYKYLDLFIGGLNGAFDLGLPLQHIVLPIGISFFTFQQIGYLVDVAEGHVERPSVLDYTLFITFFPQLIAGPIVQQSHFLPQVHAKVDWRLRAQDVGLGLALFSMGLFKKTVLADNIGRYTDAIFTTAQTTPPGTLDAWMAAIGYSFQIYFDFSGYSDMAAGLAFLWGFRMPLNFFSPYKAHNIIEFWRRWHISLSTFLRDYLYIRLGGNRHGFSRTMLALMVTMLLGGLWHGAGVQFIVWGGLHGLFLVLNHSWRRWVGHLDAPLSWWRHAAGVLLTYAAVCVAWVYFRAGSLDEANRMVAAMFGLGAPESFTPTSRGIVTFVGLYFLIAWALPNTVQLFARHHIYLPNKAFAPAMAQAAEGFGYRLTRGWAAVTALTLTVGWFAISNLSPFLYFQF
ncbi:MAG: MBOAT family O-acyltransferase [Inhella sp.]|uniref:MBOAT family O-acyltransferase n=1 Tax=Inhella sp. TaxID=1921806 RepID=UPI0039192233